MSSVKYSPQNKLLFNPNFDGVMNRFKAKPKEYSSQLSHVLGEWTAKPYKKPFLTLYCHARDEKEKAAALKKEADMARFAAKRAELKAMGKAKSGLKADTSN